MKKIQLVVAATYDAVVHRLLNAALGLEKPNASLQDGEALRGVADNINVRHRNSQMAARASVRQIANDAAYYIDSYKRYAGEAMAA